MSPTGLDNNIRSHRPQNVNEGTREQGNERTRSTGAIPSSDDSPGQCHGKCLELRATSCFLPTYLCPTARTLRVVNNPRYRSAAHRLHWHLHRLCPSQNAWPHYERHSRLCWRYSSRRVRLRVQKGARQKMNIQTETSPSGGTKQTSKRIRVCRCRGSGPTGVLTLQLLVFKWSLQPDRRQNFLAIFATFLDPLGPKVHLTRVLHITQTMQI